MKKVLFLIALLVLSIAVFASCSCVAIIDPENVTPQTESTAAGSEPDTPETNPAPGTDESQKETEITDSTAETSESTPETSESTPETSESTPETSESTPETSESTPETSESTPETSESTPETTEPEDPSKTLFVVGEATASAGATNITVPVSIRNNPGFLTLALNIDYDSSALTLTKVTNGSKFDDYTFTSPRNKASGCRVAWLSPSMPEEIVDGEVVILTFTVSDTATKGAHNITISDTRDGSNPFEFSDATGHITVN